MSDPWVECARARYVSLETYRKDGSAARTPVWIAEDEESADHRLVVWTVTDSWKVKRVRRNPAVRLAPCTARGRITGAWVDGSAAIMTTDQSAIAQRWLHRKYGIVARLGTLGSRLRRGRAGSVVLALTQRDPATG
ncbi:PPOX class F420-dependent oxidoreductase [Cumulibacter manganitolerans]|uniref:PPOX class F420-dependent oxidoreductase n=1 Tax=Cumulibacter manganitolerans TaxID=1884992 RepID=UPI001297EC7A|nr:PPOX class F420-dependent oxidoreductase [Cumulibacter manganitolerans]